MVKERGIDHTPSCDCLRAIRWTRVGKGHAQDVKELNLNNDEWCKFTNMISGGRGPDRAEACTKMPGNTKTL